MQGSEKLGKASSNSPLERVMFETTVQYNQLHASALSGLCCDLSVGGLYLKTKLPLNQDETISLSFSIPDREQDVSISCNARVAWTNFDVKRRKPTYPSGVGLQFLALSQDDMKMLSEFIDTYDENKKMNVSCAWCGSYLGMRRGPIGTTSHGICSDCRNNLEPMN